MRASIVIPTYNRLRELLPLLDAIRRTRLTDYETIVVDDGSTDGTVERCRERTDLRLLALTHAGPAVARNRGVAVARGDVLILADSDILLPEAPDVLLEMVLLLESRPEIDHVMTASDVQPIAPSAVAYNYSVYQAYFMERLLGGRAEFQGVIPFLTPRLGAIRRQAFERTGGFSETHRRKMLEEGDLGVRLVRHGLRGYFRPDLVNRHRFGTTFGEYAANYFGSAMAYGLIDVMKCPVPDPTVPAIEKARRAFTLCALSLLALSPVRPGVFLPAGAASLSLALLLGWPMHRLVFRHVPARHWAGWYAVYAAITPFVAAGYAWGRLKALLGYSPFSDGLAPG